MDRLLKLIRFSEVKIETCYYYEVNTSLLQLEIINEGIPQYINHPTKTYAQNSFFNMISTLELHKIGDFIEMHMELIKSNFQLSEKDILLRMKVEFSKAIELPLVIEIIDIFVRSTKKWKHHIEQFYKEIDIRLSKLLIDKSNDDGTKDNQYQLMSEKSRKKRLLHEIGFILIALSA